MIESEKQNELESCKKELEASQEIIRVQNLWWDWMEEQLRGIKECRAIGATSQVYENGICLGNHHANEHWKTKIAEILDKVEKARNVSKGSSNEN